MSQTWDKAGWQDAEGPGWLGRALSQPKGMGSTVGYRENKMRWGLQAAWMPALGLQGAEGRLVDTSRGVCQNCAQSCVPGSSL